MPDLLLYDSADRVVRDSQFTDKELGILDEINRRVAGAESLDALMTYVFDETASLCPCDRIGLAFLEENGQRLVAQWSKALYEPLLLKKGYSGDVHGSSLERVIRDRWIRVINDLEKYLEQNPDSVSTKILVAEGVRSNMTCPLFVDERVVGVMFRSSRKARAYTEHDMKLHQAVGVRLAQAIEKARQIEQLNEANQSYFEMLGFVVHELKSPIGSVMTDLNLITEGYLGDLTEKQKEKLGRSREKCDYLLGLISDYLNLAQLEGGQMPATLKPGLDVVGNVILPAIDVVESEIEAKGMPFAKDLPEKLKIDCDPNLLKIVMVNLLGNAAKYGKEGGAIKITAESGGGRAKISVWNEGAGFPKGQQDRLFRKFSRIKTPEFTGVKGTGVGLYTCWRILQIHKGAIRARSEYGKWAEFWIELPTRAEQ